MYETQAARINRGIREYDQETIIEVAPGPPHFTIEVRGVPKGVLIVDSKEMVSKVLPYGNSDGGKECPNSLIEGLGAHSKGLL